MPKYKHYTYYLLSLNLSRLKPRKIFKPFSTFFLFHFFFVSYIIPSFANYTEPPVRYLVEELGNHPSLNSSEITTIYQDKDGFIWVGNKPGVSRYDAYDFKNFTKAEDFFLGQIWTITEDNQGTLWIGGNNGLFFYKNGAFHPTTLDKYAIRDLHLDKKNNLWVGGLSFVPFQLTSNHLQQIQNNQAVPIQPIISQQEWTEKLDRLRVWSMDTDDNNHLWLGLDNRKASFDGEHLHVYWMDPAVNHKYDVVVAFNQDSVFWGSEGSHTFFQKNGAFETKLEITNDITYEIAVTDTACYFLTATHILQLQNGQWTSLFKFNQDNNFYFQNMLLDREGNFWVGGHGNLLKLTPTYFKTLTEEQYPILKFNFSIDELPNNTILIGGAAGKIKKIQHQTIEPYTRLDIPKNSEVRATFADNNGWIWYGTSMSGIVLERNGIQKNYSIQEGLGNKEVLFFHQTKKGNLWSGGGGLISRINVADDGQLSFDNYVPIMNNNDFPSFHTILESPNDSLWAFSDKGLFVLRNKQLQQWAFPLPSNPYPIVTGSKTDAHQQLWLSTQGEGLWQCRFNTNNEPELIKQWTSKDGLLTDVILNVHIDKKNNVWAASQLGICQLDFTLKKSKIDCFDEKDGWSNTATSKYELLESQNSQLWAVGLSGITTFPLYNLPTNKIKPKSFITRIELLDTKDNIYQYAQNEAISQQLPQDLTLPYDKNALRFYFTATSHTKAQKNKFRYQLEGIDEDWYEADALRNVFYPSLPTGTYTFKVIAANNDGLWGTAAATFSFEILPPWWSTWWAYAFYMAVIGSIVIGFYRFQLAKTVAEGESQRLKEINQLKTSLYTNITHEFRTPLTVILGMTNNLQSKADEQQWQEAHQPLEMIHRNSENLLQLVNEMLDLAKVESGNLELQVQQANVIPFIKYVSESFQSLAAEKDITLTVEVKKEVLMMDFDAAKLATIVSNLLSNAIKFTPTNGTVSVFIQTTFLKEQEHFFIKIKDSGIGISKEKIPHVFDRFYQADNSAIRKYEGTGIGLALTKELVELMQGTIEVKSKLGTGSKFMVQLPVFRKAILKEKVELPNLSSKSDIADATFFNKNERNITKDLPLVLIIEDNLDVAHYIKTCVSEKYQTLHAANGRIGIEMALEHIPDLIISDVMMPEKDGFEVCQTLKTDERSNHIPIIMLTAKVTVQDRLTGLSHGADAYLAKPFEKEELFIRLHNLLEVRRTLQQKYSNPLLVNTPIEAVVPEEDPFIIKVRNIVLEDLDNEKFAIKDLTDQLFLSRSQLHRKIKAVTGLSITIFVRQIRLQEAKKLLLSTDLSISEVAYEVGFKTPVYFSQVFKDFYKKSPSDMREQ